MIAKIRFTPHNTAIPTNKVPNISKIAFNPVYFSPVGLTSIVEDYLPNRPQGQKRKADVIGNAVD